MKKFILLFNTVKYLKFKQIYFRLFYFARAKVRKIVGFEYLLSKKSISSQLKLNTTINSYRSFENNKFIFLNLSYQFKEDIDWNFSKYGKLWTYNLCYFDYLQQKDFSKADGVSLIDNFIDQSLHVKDGLEPFPISLRGINWIKFLSYNSIENQKIDDSLYAQYYILLDNLEYHLLGNHLLENGFSLLFGAYYFDDDSLHVKAKEILYEELEEQILADGAHFELSPMYHQIMLFRVLDCINLLQNNLKEKDKKLLKFLQEKASVMLGWLEAVTFEDGTIPLLNDSANKIAPSSTELFKYATRLNLHVKKVFLKESGYRKFIDENYECIVDVGNIGPDYIPGHAHADTFNFELHINKKAFIVDTGLSTYETNTRRTQERSTSAHNTVEINSKNQSEVWGSFRVAKRAKILKLDEDKKSITVTHNGYKKENILHTREWLFEDRKIIIKDTLNKEADAVARIHFHPKITKEEILNSIVTDKRVKFIEYKYAPEFNKLINAFAIEIRFRTNLKVEINI